MFKHLENYAIASSLFLIGGSQYISDAIRFFSEHEVEVTGLVIFVTLFIKKVIETKIQSELLKQERIRTEDLKNELKEKQNL